jgi:hypothetical protein
MRAERHVAKHHGGFGEINAPAKLRLSAEKCVELLHRIFHAGNLAAAQIESKRRATS